MADFVKLKKLDGTHTLVNPDFVQSVEEIPGAQDPQTVARLMWDICNYTDVQGKPEVIAQELAQYD